MPKSLKNESLKIVVIDYQSGNLRSVAKALETAGASATVTGDPALVDDADALILPGVGSGPAAMQSLRERGLVEPLRRFASSSRPFLGVCLGLQLLMDRTDEGDASCLGLVPGGVKKLPTGLKVPHMGWNSVKLSQKHPLFKDIPQDSHFYFVHSYYALPEDDSAVAGVTDYGLPFCSVYARDNLVATQFHPEKSGTIGLNIYRNFVALATERTGLQAAGNS